MGIFPFAQHLKLYHHVKTITTCTRIQHDTIATSTSSNRHSYRRMIIIVVILRYYKRYFFKIIHHSRVVSSFSWDSKQQLSSIFIPSCLFRAFSLVSSLTTFLVCISFLQLSIPYVCLAARVCKSFVLRPLVHTYVMYCNLTGYYVC